MALVVLFLGFGLRLARLDSASLWYDETVSVHLAQKSIAALVAHTAGDIHPPGYYVLLHGWMQVAGRSQFSAAYLSLWFGLLLVALVYHLGARVFGRRAALASAVLAAFSSYNLWYSQEVRMYTLGAGLGMGVLLATISLLQPRQPGSRSWPVVAVYAGCAAAGLWVLYYFAFLLFALNLMVLAWWISGRLRAGRGWDWLGSWAAAQALALLLYVPWLSSAWRQATDPPVPPWRGFTPAGRALLETWSALSLGQSVEPGRLWPVLALTALLFGVALAGRRRRAGDEAARSGDLWRPGVPRLGWLLAGAALLPVVLIWLASHVTPLYHVRYVFTYSTPFYALLGAGLVRSGRRWRPAFWLALILLLAASAASIYAYHSDPAFAPDDHRGATAFLRDRWRPGDAILVDAGYVYPALLTYWDGDPIGLQRRLVGQGDVRWMKPADRYRPAVYQAGSVDADPGLGWGDRSSDFYAMAWPQAQEALAAVFSAFHRVWLYRCYDTVNDPDGRIREWLGANGILFEDQVFSGEAQLRVQGYLTGRDPLADTGVELAGTLDDGSLGLVARTVLQPSVDVGSRLDLDLVWRVGEVPDDGRILFAGLFDDQGQRWAQADVRPLGPLFGPADWPEGGTVRTPLRLPVPAGTLPGRYLLEVGWYRFQDGQPVWLESDAGQRWFLAGAEVAAPPDWTRLPAPQVAVASAVTVGPGLRLMGLGSALQPQGAGSRVEVVLVWQAEEDYPAAGPATLRLFDEAGRVRLEATSPLAGGRASFAGLAAGQTVLDRRWFDLPPGLEPGAYLLTVGRRDLEGRWLPVSRGPASFGEAYPLATLSIVE